VTSGASRSRLLLALTSAYLAVCCGIHDTPVATYRVPLPSAAGTGIGVGGDAAAGDSNGGAADAGAPSELVCDPAYSLVVPGLRSRYRHSTTAKNWVVAERDCELDGGHLIIIDDDAENAWMATIAEAAVTDNVSSNQLAWIGLGDSGVETEFRWVTGGAVAAPRWDAGEPNSLHETEDCVEMRANAQWNDDRCNANLAYVCECDGIPSARQWCDTSADATCGDCSTSCPLDQSCNNKQQCM
jgi:Lectin C-type domain